MKISLLILAIIFSNIAIAQFVVEVKDISGKTVAGPSEFPTRQEASEWIERHSKIESWGRIEKLVRLDGATEEDRALMMGDVIPADEERGTPSMIRTRKTFEVLGPFDVSDQRQAEAQVLEQKRARRLLAKECLAEFQSSDLDSATTIASLRSKIKSILECVIEVNKD